MALFVMVVMALPAQATQTLRVGVYDNPPKIFADDRGQASGIMGDLLLTIARAEGWQLEFVQCTWNACLALLESGAIDLMPDVALSEPRNQRFDFHKTPALLSWSQLYEAKGQRLASLLDLDHKRLAVLQGSIQFDYLQQVADSFGLEVEWVLLDSLQDGFTAVRQGRADAVAANHILGDREAYRLGLNPTPILFQPSKLFYAAGAGRQPQVLNTLDTYLQRWQSDPHSPYFEILLRWGMAPPAPAIPAGVWWSLASLALLLALGFSQLLRRKVAEKTRHLQASENRLNTILDSVEAHIYIKGQDLRYQYANRHVCELLGQTPQAIIGQTDQAFFDADTCANLAGNDRRVLEQGERVVEEEINNLNHDGTRHSFLTVKLPLRNPDGSIYALCGISTDITEHRNIQVQLHQLAFFDPLTGLPNRRQLIERLRHAVANRLSTGYDGALLLIDIDHFKVLNETQGHGAGDRLLQQVAGRLQSQLRDTDSAGRLSADEFILLAENLSASTDTAVMRSGELARQLLERLAQPYELGGHEFVTTVSIGVVMFSDVDVSLDSGVEELLKGADLALFEAKAAGRNTLRFFNPAMQIRVSQRTRLEHALRRALASDQLQLYVQPQFNSDQRCLGMEALLRWHDAELGQIAPAEFIPVAESSGLIVELGHWVLQRACQILQEWSRIPALAPLTLAVNISALQFRHPDFVRQVLERVNAAGINPQRLELEITESLLIDDLEDTIARMQELRQCGIRFSLDDFGTGYASLSYLKRLPLYQLKIDQSFIRDLLTDPNDEAIVCTIIALGRSLDLNVIAEGVETAAQARRLQTLGCHNFQGYWLGRPAAESEWRARLNGEEGSA
jgi:diguanylate cyclase (GGDEF)-like protein/PAS domain S-box-containing protein